MKNGQNTGVAWQLLFTNKARRQIMKLPPPVSDTLNVLMRELMNRGYEQSGWQNYGQITSTTDVFHCHLNNNRPRYVVVWRVLDHTKRVIRIEFVGAHESVNYRRFR